MSVLFIYATVITLNVYLIKDAKNTLIMLKYLYNNVDITNKINFDIKFEKFEKFVAFYSINFKLL